MNTPRKQILAALEELSGKYPAMRFGQLVAFVTFMARGLAYTAVWDVEDEEFLKAAQEHLAKFSGT